MSYRSGHHSTSDDSSRYRTAEAMQEWRARDPVTRFQNFLSEVGWWSADQEKALRVAVRKEVTLLCAPHVKTIARLATSLTSKACMQKRINTSPRGLVGDCACKRRSCSRCIISKGCEHDFCNPRRLCNLWRQHRMSRSHRCLISLQMCTWKCLRTLQISRRKPSSMQNSTQNACMGCLSSEVDCVHPSWMHYAILWDAWCLA